MNKIYKSILGIVSVFTFSHSFSQTNTSNLPGTPGYIYVLDNNQEQNNQKIQNGNGTIATNYTNTACGLNFTQTSVRLNQRLFSIAPATGAVQPATFSVSGIPACATVLKAFLYSSASGPVAAINATITNPASTTVSLPMTNIGSHIDKCWGYAASQTYRADVTSIISGNGNYQISGFPVIVGSNDTDGATLFIVYSDPTQNYTGSIVMADGCFVKAGGTGTVNISGFNVCATPTLATNFILVADLQKTANANMMFNSTTFNYTHAVANQFVYDFIQTNISPVIASQTSATFGIDDPSDCFNFALAGMYYRTSCMTCTTSTASSITLTAVASPTCAVASATANVSGGVGPYTYTWSPTGGNAQSISGVPAGIYTVTVNDASSSSCNVATATVNLSNVTPTITISDGNICAGSSTTLTAYGASTYTWSNGATSQSVIVTPTASVNYTVTGANGSCSSTQVVNVTVNPSPTVTAIASASLICAGQSVTLTANGATSYTFNPGNITGNPIALTPSTNVTYNIYGLDGNGCSDSTSLTVTVANCTGIIEGQVNVFTGVYPNPNKGEFIISLNLGVENGLLEIYNSIGQLVLKQTIADGQKKINLKEQADGIYHLRITKDGKQLFGSKIIKN